jgi:pyruvyl transferase EpsO
MPPVLPLLWRWQDAEARNRVAAGVKLLGRGRAVATDRMHAHILSTLLGIPHVVVDNSYGKLRSFYETWAANLEFAQWADSPSDAIEAAKALAVSHHETLGRSAR